MVRVTEILYSDSKHNRNNKRIKVNNIVDTRQDIIPLQNPGVYKMTAATEVPTEAKRSETEEPTDEQIGY